jgi:hypothetical protein
MTHVDLEDRAPGGESRAFLEVADVLVDALPSCSSELLSEVANKVCEALEELGRQQEDPARVWAALEEWQRETEQIVARVRARKAGQS